MSSAASAVDITNVKTEWGTVSKPIMSPNKRLTKGLLERHRCSSPSSPEVSNRRKTIKVIKNSPKCHLLQPKYRGPDLSPPIRERCVQLSLCSINYIPMSWNYIALSLMTSDTHCLSGLYVGWSVCQDVFEDGFQGLEHLLTLDARAQLDTQQAGQGSRRSLLFALAWHSDGWGIIFFFPPFLNFGADLSCQLKQWTWPRHSRNIKRRRFHRLVWYLSWGSARCCLWWSSFSPRWTHTGSVWPSPS